MHSIKEIKHDQRKIEKAVRKNFSRQGVSTVGMTKEEILEQAVHDPFYKEGIRMGYDMAQIAIFDALRQEFKFGDVRLQRVKDRVSAIIAEKASH